MKWFSVLQVLKVLANLAIMINAYQESIFLKEQRKKETFCENG